MGGEREREGASERMDRSSSSLHDDDDQHQQKKKDAWFLVLELVLPWLSLRDLVAVACTCSSIAQPIASIHQRRIADLSRGLEPWPVPIINKVDHLPYPFFAYTPSCRLPSSSPPAQPWGCPGSRVPVRPAVPLPPDRLLSAKVSLGVSGCNCVSDCSDFQELEWDTPADWIESDSKIEIANENVENRMKNTFSRANLHVEGGWDEMADGKSSKKRRTSQILISTLCPCTRTSDGKFAYDRRFKLRFLTDDPTLTPEKGGIIIKDLGNVFVSECGAACSCDSRCKNRVSQRGLAVKVAVVRHKLKGWSLHSAQFISRGSFVCEYAGELLTTMEAQDRQKLYDKEKLMQNASSALLVLREHLPSGQACLRLNIDGTRAGNVARFINHACDGGNLLPCMIRSTGSFIPRVAFFANRDIYDSEELTFSYGEVLGGAQSQPCVCGTSVCKGVMPSEWT